MKCYFKNNLAVFLSFLLIIIIISTSSLAQYTVGVIRTPLGKSPDKCYKLVRNQIIVKPLFQDMEVLNGDIIEPHKGRSVILKYRHTGCGEKVVNTKTEVECRPEKLKKTNWFMNLLSKAEKKIKLKRVKLEKVWASPTRSIRGLSIWPVDGSTLLYGKPIIFSWSMDENIRPLTKAQLVIFRRGEKVDKPFRIYIKTNELNYANIALQAGEIYEWYVEIDGKKVSRNYHFQILSKKETENIQSQLAEVDNEYKNQNVVLRKALYLQIISDLSSNLDLYADSLRMMMEYKNKDEISLANEIFDRMSIHIDKASGIYPIELNATLMIPVPNCDNDSNCMILEDDEESLDNSPCAGKKYYKIKESVKWNEIDKHIIDKCSVVAFILKNRSISKSDYYFSILNIHNTHLKKDVEVIYPLSEQSKKSSALAYGKILDLSSEGGYQFNNNGKNTILLFIDKTPINIFPLDVNGSEYYRKWSTLHFSIVVK